MQYIIRCRNGERWKVRQAVSLNAALDEIAMARVTGSIGGQTVVHDHSTVPPKVTVRADVHRINSDGTEQEAYRSAY